MNDKLRDLFCLKINVELDEFKKSLLDKSPQEVYDSAYMIDCMINLKEVLLEKSTVLEPKELRLMVKVPELLHFIYNEWLDYEDSRMEEYGEFISQSIKDMEGHYKAA